MRGAGPSKGRWFEYDGERERFEERELAQLRARKRNLTKYATAELEEIARARDEELCDRLQRLAGKRWGLLLDCEGLASEIRTLESAITTSYYIANSGPAALDRVTGVEQQGHIARSAFIETICQSGIVHRNVAREVFEGFAAIQYLRKGLIIFELDDVDAREIVAAAQFCHPKPVSAAKRLITDLFDVYGSTHIRKEEFETLLTIGVESIDQLCKCRPMVDSAWRESPSLADRVKGRIAREDFRKIMHTTLKTWFAPLALRSGLQSEWEGMYLPKSLADLHYQSRRAKKVDDQFKRLRCHWRLARAHRCWNLWRGFVLRRRKLRNIFGACIHVWGHRTQYQAFGAWVRILVADIMAQRIQNFIRKALFRIRAYQRGLRKRAASTIQNTWRGALARRWLSQMKVLRDHAARTIQRFWRVQRDAYQVKLALFRSISDGWQVERVEACIKIQSTFRMYLAKLRAISRRQAIIGRRKRAQKEGALYPRRVR